MALPTYASPLERVWYYTYLVICALVFLFLIAPILIVIPLSFNAEPYFTFTPKMLAFDPAGWSMRWYDALLTLGHPVPDTARDSTWWSMVWERATWVQAAKNSFWIGLWATILATTLGTIAALGLSRPEMPYRRVIMALLISPMIVPIIIIAVGMSFFFAKACVAPDSAMGTIFGVFLSEKGCLANSHLGVIVAHAVLGIPFVIITVTATLSGFDQSLIRAAHSLGANPRTTFFKVIMPLIL
ncbi:MAG: ABC transporter permease subunit, partial [Tabrizicola sp.]|nr:ABC transporter permease subunit [Tabrizicola sp.]